jgi:hypothetical protein
MPSNTSIIFLLLAVFFFLDLAALMDGGEIEITLRCKLNSKNQDTKKYPLLLGSGHRYNRFRKLFCGLLATCRLLLLT